MRNSVWTYLQNSDETQLLGLLCLSVCLQIGFLWVDFHELCVGDFSLEFVDQIVVCLELDKNNKHFTWRCTCMLTSGHL